MPDSPRIHYHEDSDLPYFVQDDSGPMTQEEARQMLPRRDIKRVAKAIQPALHEFIETQLYFRDGVGEAIGKIAREVMGQDRPLSDDDAEYYAFCDYLYFRVTRQIEAALDGVS